MDELVAFALSEARKLESAGLDACIVENVGDVPLFRDHVPAGDGRRDGGARHRGPPGDLDARRRQHPPQRLRRGALDRARLRRRLHPLQRGDRRLRHRPGDHPGLRRRARPAPARARLRSADLRRRARQARAPAVRRPDRVRGAGPGRARRRRRGDRLRPAQPDPTDVGAARHREETQWSCRC